MNCKHYRTRIKNTGIVLNTEKKVSLFCKKYDAIEYKEIKFIKKRTNKQAQVEINRRSIFTNDLDYCIIVTKERITCIRPFSGEIDNLRLNMD